MKAGDVVEGKITGIKPYGAFVKIDDQYDGLIHISEISEGYVKNIEDHMKVGDEVKAKVLKVKDDNKVSLSYKAVNKTKKKKREDVELKSGFKPFETMLPEWVKKYRNDGN